MLPADGNVASHTPGRRSISAAGHGLDMIVPFASVAVSSSCLFRSLICAPRSWRCWRAEGSDTSSSFGHAFWIKLVRLIVPFLNLIVMIKAISKT